MTANTNIQNLTYTIGTILRDTRQTLDKRLKAYDLTRYEWLIIALLHYYQGCVNQTVVREYIGIDDSYLTKVLDKLAEKQIIMKAVSEQDRRARVIKIHPANAHIVQGVYAQLQTFNEHMLSVLTPEERLSLFQMLEKIHNKLHR